METASITAALNHLRQGVSAADHAYQVAEQEVRDFTQQMENRIKDVQAKLQELVQKEQEFQVKLDQNLQTLEQEINKNNGIVASLSPGNSLSKREQVAQKWVALLQGLRQLEESVQEVSKELDLVLGEYHQAAGQILTDVTPLRTALGHITTQLGTLAGQVESLTSAASTAPSSASPQSIPERLSSFQAQLLGNIYAAQTAFINVQQGLAKAQVMRQLLTNIEDFGRQYGLS